MNTERDHLIVNKVLYFKNLKDYFICLLCNNILKSPLMCCQCITPFCSSCIKKWLNSNKLCPNGCLITDSSITEVKGCAKKFLDELKLKCKYGCEVSFTDYDEHVLKCNSSHIDDIECWNCKS